MVARAAPPPKANSAAPTPSAIKYLRIALYLAFARDLLSQPKA
jgi:hypothetical protein